MSDTITSLLGSGMGSGNGPDVSKIKRKGKKYVVEGVGEFDTYEAAVAALQTPVDPIHGQGPTMTSGESALDFGNEKDGTAPSIPSAKVPNTSTPDAPKKPEWVMKSEKSAGVEYEWDPMKKQWRPKKGVSRNDAARGQTAEGKA